LLALKCILAASALQPDHPTVHEQAIRFKQAVDSASETLPKEVTEVIKSDFTLLPASKSLADINDEFRAKHKDSALHVLSAIRAQKLLTKDSSAGDADVVAILDYPSITFQEAREGLELLSASKSKDLEAYRSKAAAKWPEVTVFQVKS
jgi:hypothetical protein